MVVGILGWRAKCLWILQGCERAGLVLLCLRMARMGVLTFPHPPSLDRALGLSTSRLMWRRAHDLVDAFEFTSPTFYSLDFVH